MQTKRILDKVLVTAFISVTTLFIFTGCSKRADDKELETALGLNDNSKIQQGEESTNIKTEHINYVIESSDYKSKITVDADLNETNVTSLPVYNITKHGMDDDYIKNLAKLVFDNGEYKYIKSYYGCSLEELDEAHKWLKEISTQYKGSFYYPLPLENDIEDWLDANSKADKLNVQNISDEKYYMSFNVDTNLNDIGINEVSECKFTGNIGGENWILTSKLVGNYHQAILYKSKQMEPIFCLLNSNSSSDESGEIDMDKGEDYASEWLSKLGYKDYELIDTSKTLTIIDADTSAVNGCVFTYARSINGLKTPYIRRFNDYTKFADYINTPQEYIAFYVDKYGVEQINFISNYELGNEISEKAELLNFNQINEVAKRKMQEGLLNQPNKANDYDLLIDKIQLCYMAVSDENNMYSFLPAWVYHINYGQNNGSNETTDICINAIDGTLINKTINYSSAEDYEIHSNGEKLQGF